MKAGLTVLGVIICVIAPIAMERSRRKEPAKPEVAGLNSEDRQSGGSLSDEERGAALYERMLEESKVARETDPATGLPFYNSLAMTRFTWRRGGFGTTMQADFNIYNSSKFALKDIEITCVHAGSSGTIIDRNTRTIYDAIQPGESKSYTNFDMGFIHSQAASSKATITGASR